MPNETWECLTHGYKLSIEDEGKTRNFATPPGSLHAMPRCMLFLLGGGAGGQGMPYGPLAEGKYENCVVRKVK